MGKDGIECPSFCPAKCGEEEMTCSGGIDFNDCMMPEFCIPSKGTLNPEFKRIIGNKMNVFRSHGQGWHGVSG